jgi:hypothetical protein
MGEQITYMEYMKNTYKMLARKLGGKGLLETSRSRLKEDNIQTNPTENRYTNF